MIDLTKLSKEELIELKKKTEVEIANYKTMDSAIKVSLNSMYGIMSNEHFMYFDNRSAEAVTITGQMIIRYIARRIDEYMNKLLGMNTQHVVYIDTDSVSINMRPFLEKFGVTDEKALSFLVTSFEKKIVPFIGQVSKELYEVTNAAEETLSMKIDTIADKVMFFSKKRYIFRVLYAEGVYYTTPEAKIMGIDAIKSSTPEICREAMKKTLDLILEADEEKVQNFIAAFKMEFFNSPPEKIAFPRGVSDVSGHTGRDGSYIKGTSMHTKAAIIYNKTLRELGLEDKYPPIGDGGKVYYFPLRTGNLLREEVMGIKDTIPPEIENRYKISKYIDYNEQFRKTFLDPIDTIMRTVNMTAEPSDALF